MGGDGCGHEVEPVQPESLEDIARHHHMPNVGWIEGAAQEPDFLDHDPLTISVAASESGYRSRSRSFASSARSSQPIST